MGKIGKNSVVIGNRENDVGENCVVIDPGVGGGGINIGTGANSSVNIGTNAGANIQLSNDLQKIQNLINQAGTEDEKLACEQLVAETKKQTPNPIWIKQYWGIVSNSGALEGAFQLSFVAKNQLRCSVRTWRTFHGTNPDGLGHLSTAEP